MVPLAAFALALASQSDWPAYGHDAGGQRYVALSSINKGNVAKLKVAWTFHTGDLSDAKGKPGSAFECTPIFADGWLYVVSPFNRVFALDPDTGRARWTFDPAIPKSWPFAVEPFACRGVSTWKPRIGHRRIILATHDARLIEIDASSGKRVETFGVNGEVKLRSGVGNKYLFNYNETSAPCVVNDLIVVGSSIGDNGAVEMPSGVVRAYDAETGLLKWSWDPVAGIPPFTNQSGATLKTGAGNAWTTLSADPERDMLFVPTGSASPDFSGAARPGDDRDADSVVALRASTGERLWAFQVVHHNLWDYDVASQPMLVEVGGKPAVVAMTKMGHVFVLDRLTGQPMLPVEERPVSQDGVAGEPLSLTQPFPVLPKPLVPARFEAWALTAANKKFVEDRVAGTKNEGIFAPPSVQGTIMLPGSIGGCNWSGGSYDPASSTLYVNTNNLAMIAYLIPRSEFNKVKESLPGHEVTAQTGAPYGIRRETVLAPGGIPGNKPPWGVLHAIDLSSGSVRWEKPLGYMPQYEELPAARDWGSPNFGGSFVTSSGLVFIAATVDTHIRAFDSDSGKVLWEALLPAGGQAAPMTFKSSKTGRQYIVQCAGGHHGLGSAQGDSVVAFALPH